MVARQRSLRINKRTNYVIKRFRTNYINRLQLLLPSVVVADSVRRQTVPTDVSADWVTADRITVANAQTTAADADPTHAVVTITVAGPIRVAVDRISIADSVARVSVAVAAAPADADRVRPSGRHERDDDQVREHFEHG